MSAIASTVFLDFDGVLFNNKKANNFIYHKAAKYVSSRVGIPIDSAKILNEQFYPSFGHTTRMINSMRLTKNAVTIDDFNEFVYDEETYDFISNLNLTNEDKLLHKNWTDTLNNDCFDKLFVLSNAPSSWINICLHHLNNSTMATNCIIFDDIISVPERMNGALKPCVEAYDYMEFIDNSNKCIYVEDNPINFKYYSSIHNVLFNNDAKKCEVFSSEFDLYTIINTPNAIVEL